MHIIFSKPKELFAGIWGVSKLEKFAFSLIAAFILAAVLPTVQKLAGYSAGHRPVPVDNSLLAAITAGAAMGLYFAAGAVVTLLVRHHNKGIQQHIDAVDRSISERAGQSFDRDLTPVLIGVAVAGGHAAATVRTRDLSYDFEFSGAGPQVVVSAEGNVKRSALKSALTNLRAGIHFA